MFKLVHQSYLQDTFTNILHKMLQRNWEILLFLKAGADSRSIRHQILDTRHAALATNKFGKIQEATIFVLTPYQKTPF